MHCVTTSAAACRPQEIARENNFQAALTDIQGIISIEPRRYFAQLNQSLDYSFLDTPLAPPPPPNVTANASALNGSANGTAAADSPSSRIILRQVEPNPRIPAYVHGVLVWGSPPGPGDQASCIYVYAAEIGSVDD